MEPTGARGWRSARGRRSDPTRSVFDFSAVAARPARTDQAPGAGALAGQRLPGAYTGANVSGGTFPHARQLAWGLLGPLPLACPGTPPRRREAVHEHHAPLRVRSLDLGTVSVPLCLPRNPCQARLVGDLGPAVGAGLGGGAGMGPRAETGLGALRLGLGGCRSPEWRPARYTGAVLKMPRRARPPAVAGRTVPSR